MVNKGSRSTRWAYAPNKVWVALGKSLPEFVYFAVKIIAGLCQVRLQVFRFGKNFANRQNIRDAVVLGWGRQIFAKSSQTMGITAVTVLSTLVSVT